MSESLLRGYSRSFCMLAVASAVLVVGSAQAVGATPPSTRAYELLSPPDKSGQATFFYVGGVATGTTRAARSGDAAVFTSWGTFAGSRSGMPASYRAVRGAAGWVTGVASPPPGVPNPDAFSTVATLVDAADEVETGVLWTSDTFDPGDDNRSLDVYRTDTAGRPTLVSRGNNGERTDAAGVTYHSGGISKDGFTIAFETASHLVPQDAGRVASNARDVYENSDGVTRLVNLGPDGRVLSACGSQLGSSNTRRHAVSSGGDRVFFQTPSPSGHSDPACSAPSQLYVRENGTSTVHVSRTQRTVPDPSGVQSVTYQGAALDGRAVLFSSHEMLTDDATPGGGVYRFQTGSRELALLHGVSEQIVNISADGRRVYFTSYSSLLPGQPSTASEKLYVHDDRGIRLVVENSTDVPFEFGAYAPMTTPDGRHLLFVARAPLTGFDNLSPGCAGHPTSRCNELFVYSEDRGLVCVSCDPAGQRAVSSAARLDVTLRGREDQDSAISADGSRVAFDTGDQLTPEDTNLRSDVYEYSDGRLSLISGGRGPNDSYFIGMSASGRDVFFATSDSLVPQDTDGNQDIYDARLDGGFPSSPTGDTASCLGDACQGSLGPRAPVWMPQATGDLTGDGQALGTETRQPKPAGLRILRVSRRAKRAAARSGRLTVRLRVIGGGRLVVLATPVGGHGMYGRVNRRILSAASRRIRVTLALSANAKRRLTEQGRLPIRITARLAGTGTTQQRTVTLTTEGDER